MTCRARVRDGGVCEPSFRCLMARATGTSGDGGQGEGGREQLALTTGQARPRTLSATSQRDVSMETSAKTRSGQPTTTRTGREKREEQARTPGTPKAHRPAVPRGQDGKRRSPSTRCQQVKRHALPIALSPDGEYIRPGDRRWASGTVDSGTQDQRTAPRGDAREGQLRQARECTSMWMCPEGLRRTGPHTGGTWSRRLNGGADSSSGALCTCNAPTKMRQSPRTDVSALTEQVAGKMARKKGRVGTIRSLLQDLAVFVWERNGGEHRQAAAEENYVHMLQAMESGDMEPWDVSPTGDISPTGNQDGNPDRGRLTVETASKGLGLAGKVHVPQEMWDRLRPCNWVELFMD